MCHVSFPLLPRTAAVEPETVEKLTDLLRQYRDAAGEGDFRTAGEKLARMKDLLNEAQLEPGQ
jgi:hypothetical protein